MPEAMTFAPERLTMRVYGQWAGNPKGVPENPAKCVESVYSKADLRCRQCSRKRGFGPNGEYCRQHAKRHAAE